MIHFLLIAFCATLHISESADRSFQDGVTRNIDCNAEECSSGSLFSPSNAPDHAYNNSSDSYIVFNNVPSIFWLHLIHTPTEVKGCSEDIASITYSVLDMRNQTIGGEMSCPRGGFNKWKAIVSTTTTLTFLLSVATSKPTFKIVYSILSCKDIPHATISLKVNNTFSVTCDRGYELAGATDIACNSNNGSWTPASRCEGEETTSAFLSTSPFSSTFSHQTDITSLDETTESTDVQISHTTAPSLTTTVVIGVSVGVILLIIIIILLIVLYIIYNKRSSYSRKKRNTTPDTVFAVGIRGDNFHDEHEIASASQTAEEVDENGPQNEYIPSHYSSIVIPETSQSSAPSKAAAAAPETMEQDQPSIQKSNGNTKASDNKRREPEGSDAYARVLPSNMRKKNVIEDNVEMVDSIIYETH